jgi:hypothetical protein
VSAAPALLRLVRNRRRLDGVIGRSGPDNICRIQMLVQSIAQVL